MRRLGRQYRKAVRRRPFGLAKQGKHPVRRRHLITPGGSSPRYPALPGGGAGQAAQWAGNTGGADKVDSGQGGDSEPRNSLWVMCRIGSRRPRHLPPLLVRDGSVQLVELPRNFPLGMFPDAGSYQAGEVALRPGDRLVVFTDGMRERNAAKLDLPAELCTMIGLHPREAVRMLADAVLDAAGPTLADDATLLIVDWYGDHPQLRRTGAGADPERASPPLPG